MPFYSRPPLFFNRLLAILPERDRQLVLTNSESVELESAKVISEPGDRILQVYFPIDSYFSILTPSDDRAALEVRQVGNEGMIGTPLILGIEVTALRTLVQGAGTAWRMPSEWFSDALRQSSAFKITLDRYLFVLMSDAERMVACTRFHVLEARLARWLLMTQDRSQSDRFHVTHELLSSLLGVRRVGVTRAASTLQRRRLIEYRRGDVEILDRPRLIEAAAGCYGTAEAMYDRILKQSS